MIVDGLRSCCLCANEEERRQKEKSMRDFTAFQPTIGQREGLSVSYQGKKKDKDEDEEEVERKRKENRKTHATPWRKPILARRRSWRPRALRCARIYEWLLLCGAVCFSRALVRTNH